MVLMAAQPEFLFSAKTFGLCSFLYSMKALGGLLTYCVSTSSLITRFLFLWGNRTKQTESMNYHCVKLWGKKLTCYLGPWCTSQYKYIKYKTRGNQTYRGLRTFTGGGDLSSGAPKITFPSRQKHTRYFTSRGLVWVTVGWLSNWRCENTKNRRSDKLHPLCHQSKTQHAHMYTRPLYNPFILTLSILSYTMNKRSSFWSLAFICRQACHKTSK